MPPLIPGTQLHPQLQGYYLTPETVKPLQELLDRTTATETCYIPFVSSACTTAHTRAQTQARMIHLLTQMDARLNPHRLITSPSTDIPHAINVLDPRLHDLALQFLPKLPSTERFSFSEIDAAAARFATIATESGLALFASTSPCHTADPQSLTCTWNTFPGEVDGEVWLESGDEVHPKLAETYLSQRAAAVLEEVLKRGKTPEAQALLAELVLKIDRTFDPYRETGRYVIMDGSVAALDNLLGDNFQPGTPITEDNAQYITDKFQSKWAPYFKSARHMICDATELSTNPFIGASFRITCGYSMTPDNAR